MAKGTLVATCAACHPAGENVAQAAAITAAALSGSNPPQKTNGNVAPKKTNGSGAPRASKPTSPPGAAPDSTAGAKGGPSVHMPYAAGDCNACHAPHGANNPRLLVGGGGDAHCAQCHPALVSAMSSTKGSALEPGLYTHGGIEGGCNACHAPHLSTKPSLLKDEPGKLCISCHQDIGKAVDGAVVSHDAVLKGAECLSCHDPHAARNAMMLREDQRPVCLSCHDKAVTARDGRTIPEMASLIARSPVVHGPVAAGDCGECHAVHGGEHAKLLRQLAPEILPRPFDERNFALCFSCHDRALVMTEKGSATAFRDGERNMHRIHVVSETKSRGCGSCHAVHASDHPRLIAGEVAFEGSGWMMPMNFVVEPEGGSCAPGCHEPMRYRRTAAPKDVPGADREKKGGGP
jgi:predicted CXXCH cytochrome family protein